MFVRRCRARVASSRNVVDKLMLPHNTYQIKCKNKYYFASRVLINIKKDEFRINTSVFAFNLSGVLTYYKKSRGRVGIFHFDTASLC